MLMGFRQNSGPSGKMKELNPLSTNVKYTSTTQLICVNYYKYSLTCLEPP